VKREKDKDEDWLKNELEELSERLNRLEGILSDLSKPMDRFREVTSDYFRLMSLYSEHGTISPELLVPEVKDSISRDIIKILFEKSGQNISQITNSVRKKRGKASRRIVRSKIQDLEELGIVVGDQETKWTVYSISPELVKKWSQLLGLSK
jgi:DNA-binding transcriptional ArsR family regulator